jgi:hypothetical protein
LSDIPIIGLRVSVDGLVDHEHRSAISPHWLGALCDQLYGCRNNQMMRPTLLLKTLTTLTTFTTASVFCVSACKSHDAAPSTAAPAKSEAVSSASEDDPSADDEKEQGVEGDDVALPPVTPAPTAESRAKGALRIEAGRELSVMKSSTYSHHTHVDEANGVFEYDCSGFADYALARIAPSALDEVRKATVARPLSRHFVAFFQSLPPNAPPNARWHRVIQAKDLLPGDIISWLKPTDVKSKNTGHTMIVREVPAAAHDSVVDVPIFDSTSVAHGKGDSRTPSHATGLGEGTIHLIIGADGVPNGYRWSDGKRARAHSTTVTFGRLDG